MEDSKRSWRGYWKTPILVGIGFCVLQVLLAIVRFGSMDSWDPANVLFVIPNILFGLVLFFVGGVLVGVLAQRLLRGVIGSWRVVLLVAFAVATPLAVGFSLVGGLLGPHMVVIGALVPYLLLVGLPVLLRTSWQRVRSRSGRTGLSCSGRRRGQDGRYERTRHA